LRWGMDLYEETIKAVKEFINSNRNIFYDNRDRFRVAASALNNIAYVYENYGGEACKLFLKDKGRKERKREGDLYDRLYDKLIEIIRILDSNTHIKRRRSVGRYIIKNLDVITKL
jgi:hypothetical protein